MKAESTLQHAQRAIGSLSPAAKLVAFYNQFPKDPPPQGKVPANSFRVWCLNRIKELSGASTFWDASKNDNFNTVLAFGYLMFSQDPSNTPPKINQFGRAPAGVVKLEPDFFPTLLRELRSESQHSSAFALKIKNAQQELAQVIARLEKTSPKVASGSSHPALEGDGGGPGLGGAIVGIVTCVIFFVAMGKKIDKVKT